MAQGAKNSSKSQIWDLKKLHELIQIILVFGSRILELSLLFRFDMKLQCSTLFVMIASFGLGQLGGQITLAAWAIVFVVCFTPTIFWIQKTTLFMLHLHFLTFVLAKAQY